MEQGERKRMEIVLPFYATNINSTTKTLHMVQATRLIGARETNLPKEHIVSLSPFQPLRTTIRREKRNSYPFTINTQ